MKITKKVIISLVGLALIAVGFGGYARYQAQMRDARPILKLLAENKVWDAGLLILDGPRLKEVGAHKVWKTIIKELATATDMQEIDTLFSVIISLQEKRLYFQEEGDWQIIKAAAERYNQVPKSHRPCDYLIFKHEYDGYWLSFRIERS